jgi:hypothetical protein
MRRSKSRGESDGILPIYRAVAHFFFCVELADVAVVDERDTDVDEER